MEGLGLLACVLQIVCVHLIQDVCQKWECTFSLVKCSYTLNKPAKLKCLFRNPDAVKTIQTIIEELRELHTTFFLTITPFFLSEFTCFMYQPNFWGSVRVPFLKRDVQCFPSFKADF
jgi:hypothetical protein